MKLTSEEKYHFEKRLTSLNNKSKRNDNFDLVFLNIPENFGNLLNKQIKSFERPIITYESTYTNFKGGTYRDKGKYQSTPFTIEFYDDENGVTSALLYMQLMRQNNRFRDIMSRPEGSDDLNRFYKFSIEVRFYTSTGEEAEALLIEDCFITEITHSQSDRTDDGESTITLRIEHDNLAIKVFDEFVKVV